MKVKFYQLEIDFPDGGTSLRPRLAVVEFEGRAVEGVWGEHQYMAAQLSDDVTSIRVCDELLTDIDIVASGKPIGQFWSGNAWFAEIQPDGVTFENLHDEDEVGGKVSLATYRAAVVAWRQFLLEAGCLERVVDLPGSMGAE